MKHCLSTLLLLATAALSAIAQPSFTLSVSPTSVNAGSPVNLTINFNADPNIGVAALQWVIVPPVGSTFGQPTFGPIFSSASKATNCNPANANCVAAGLNQTVIGSGTAETIQITTPVSARGAQTIMLTNPTGASPSGSLVTVGSNAVTFTVGNPFDLNGDGKVDIQDLTLAMRQVVGVDPCTAADFDHDGKCDVRDLMMLVLTALGGNP